MIKQRQLEIDKAIDLINKQSDDVYRVLRGLQYHVKQSVKDAFEDVIDTLTGSAWFNNDGPDPAKAIKMLEKMRGVKA